MTMEMTVNVGRQDCAVTDEVGDWDGRQTCSFYEVVQGGRHKVSLDWPKGLEIRVFQAYRGSVSNRQEHRLLQENIIRNKHNRNWQGSRRNDLEAVNQVFGANKVEIKQKTLEACRLLRQVDHALDRIHEDLADCTVYT
jgi:hypothetical protein